MNLNLFELVASTVLILSIKRIFEWLTAPGGPISKWKERLRTNQKWMKLRYRIALLHGSGAEMEFALSQAVASGDAFEHRPSECGHCVQDFLADLDFRDLPGEAAGFELGADDTLPTADLRFYPAALGPPRAAPRN